MVRKIFAFFHRDVVGVHRVAYLLAGSTLLSQVLALARDRLLASEFGAGLSLDIYYAAFRVQDILFFFFASLLSISVIIPFLIDRVEGGGAKEFIDSIFSVFFVGIVVVGLILFFLTPFLLPILFPGLWGKGMDQDIIDITRILLLSPILLGLSNLLTSISQIFQKFYLYALSPILYNLGIIIGIIFFYPALGLPGLAYGVILGAALHLLVQIPFAISRNLFPKFTLVLNFNEIRGVIALSLPRTLTLSLNYFVLLIFTALASRMAEGSITVLNFSLNIQSVPLALIGASYSVAAFPILVKHYGSGAIEEFIQNITIAARHIIFWSLPAMAIFIVLRAHIVRVILGGGEFDWADTRLTAAALALFVVSIVAQSLSLLFIRGFYAKGDTKMPLGIVLFSSVVTIAIAFLGNIGFDRLPALLYFFEFLLRVEGEVGTKVLLLPLSFSIGSIIQAILLHRLLHISIGSPIHLHRSLFEGLSGAVAGGFTAYVLADKLGGIFGLESLINVFLIGSVSGLLGIFAAYVVLSLLKSKELSEVTLSLHSRFKKKDVIISGE